MAGRVDGQSIGEGKRGAEGSGWESRWAKHKGGAGRGEGQEGERGGVEGRWREGDRAEGRGGGIV